MHTLIAHQLQGQASLEQMVSTNFPLFSLLKRQHTGRRNIFRKVIHSVTQEKLAA
jgi:hypothetical protein